MNLIMNSATVMLAASGAENLINNLLALAISIIMLLIVIKLIPHLLNPKITKLITFLVLAVAVVYFANNLGAFEALGKAAENMTK